MAPLRRTWRWLCAPPNQARLLRQYHGWATLFWMAMVPVSVVTGWWHSVGYVTVLSLWALVATEFGAYQGSRAETAVKETPHATGVRA